LVVIGVIVAAVSALADEIGIGDEEAFGPQQTAGLVVGLVVAAGGFVVAWMAGGSGNDTDV
jgi:hypothetical protein